MIEKFDAVQMIREIREKHWNEIKDLSREEQIKHIRERTLKAVELQEQRRRNYYAEKSKTAQENQ